MMPGRKENSTGLKGKVEETFQKALQNKIRDGKIGEKRKESGRSVEEVQHPNSTSSRKRKQETQW